MSSKSAVQGTTACTLWAADLAKSHEGAARADLVNCSRPCWLRRLCNQRVRIDAAHAKGAGAGQHPRLCGVGSRAALHGYDGRKAAMLAPV